MGSSLPAKTVESLRSHWPPLCQLQLAHSGPNYYLWYNQLLRQSLIEYAFTIVSESLLKQHVQSYFWRHNHGILVNTRYFQQQFDDGKYSIFYERVFTNLSRIKDLCFEDCLEFYYAGFKGFQILYERFGGFQIQQQMFHITQDSKVKIWCDKNISRIYPASMWATPDSQQKMVKKIINIIDSNADKAKMKVNIGSIIDKQASESFSTALVKFLTICKQCNFHLAGQLKCIYTIYQGGVENQVDQYAPHQLQVHRSVTDIHDKYHQVPQQPINFIEVHQQKPQSNRSLLSNQNSATNISNKNRQIAHRQVFQPNRIQPNSVRNVGYKSMNMIPPNAPKLMKLSQPVLVHTKNNLFASPRNLNIQISNQPLGHQSLQLKNRSVQTIRNAKKSPVRFNYSSRQKQSTVRHSQSSQNLTIRKQIKIQDKNPPFIANSQYINNPQLSPKPNATYNYNFKLQSHLNGNKNLASPYINAKNIARSIFRQSPTKIQQKLNLNSQQITHIKEMDESNNILNSNKKQSNHSLKQSGIRQSNWQKQQQQLQHKINQLLTTFNQPHQLQAQPQPQPQQPQQQSKNLQLATPLSSAKHKHEQSVSPYGNKIIPTFSRYKMEYQSKDCHIVNCHSISTDQPIQQQQLDGDKTVVHAYQLQSTESQTSIKYQQHNPISASTFISISNYKQQQHVVVPQPTKTKTKTTAQTATAIKQQNSMGAGGMKRYDRKIDDDIWNDMQMLKYKYKHKHKQLHTT